MSPSLQSWAQVLSLGAIIVGALLYQTHYIDKVIEGLRNEINERFKTVDQQFKTMEERFNGLRIEVKAEIAGLRTEMKAEIAGLRSDMNQRFDNVEGRLDRLEHPVLRG
jgi:ABC-type phosphate transport system auxiliary subunit